MTPLALHLPDQRGVARWALAAAAILAAHGALIAALAHWYTRTPPEEKVIPAIMVSLEAAPSAPVEDDKPLAAEEKTRIDPTPEPSKVESKVEPPPPEDVVPPPRPAEIVLPKPEPKPVEKKPVERKLLERKLVEKKLVEKKPVEKKPVEMKRVERFQPPQEASARAAAREAPRQSSAAASNSYKSLVYGHLQRFRSYPASLNGATGHVVARFVLSRTGNVLGASIVQSSGNAALDAAALATVRSANPFPPFPAEMTVSQASFDAPINFNRQQ